MWPLQPFKELFLFIRYFFAVKLVFACVAAILTVKFAGPIGAVVLAVIYLSLLIFYKIKLEKPLLHWHIIGLCAFILMSFLMYQKENSRNSNPFEEYFKGTSSFTGIIKSFPQTQRDLQRVVIRLTDPVEKDIYAFIPECDGKHLEYGDSISFSGSLSEPPGRRNPGAFDYREYLFRKNIRATAFIDTNKLEIIQRGRGNVLMQHVVVPLRTYITNTVKKHVGYQGTLLLSILLGSKHELDESVRNDFKESGLMHVLAVSGLHVGLIAFVFFNLFSIFMLPRSARTVFVIVIIWFYALITGMGPSVVRASVMGTIILLALLFERDGNIYNSLGLAGVILLFMNPLNLWDVGFILSFTATFSIVFLYPKFKEWVPRKLLYFSPIIFIIDLFLVSLAAMLGTLPIVAAFFNNIPIISLLANLFAVPLISILVALGVVIVLLGTWWPAAAGIFGNTAWLLSGIIVTIVDHIAEIPFGSFAVAAPQGWHMVFYVLGLFCVYGLRHKKWARKGLAFIIVLFLNISVYSALYSKVRPQLKITFLDVGQGDCCMIEFPDKKTMLVDGGMKSRWKDYGERVVIPYCRHAGIRKIDMAVLTHADADHLGGLVTVLKEMPVDIVIDPGY
ncbi:MAG: DNA internalization-related competence protein ComEC/Rec2, partial [bacterium]